MSSPAVRTCGRLRRVHQPRGGDALPDDEFTGVRNVSSLSSPPLSFGAHTALGIR